MKCIRSCIVRCWLCAYSLNQISYQKMLWFGKRCREHFKWIYESLESIFKKAIYSHARSSQNDVCWLEPQNETQQKMRQNKFFFFVIPLKAIVPFYFNTTSFTLVHGGVSWFLWNAFRVCTTKRIQFAQQHFDRGMIRLLAHAERLL